ncbi:MAG: hypothetical protein ACK559_13060, partial [bacterium]
MPAVRQAHQTDQRQLGEDAPWEGDAGRATAEVQHRPEGEDQAQRDEPAREPVRDTAGAAPADDREQHDDAAEVGRGAQAPARGAEPARRVRGQRRER